jgi:hypothetical protein
MFHSPPVGRNTPGEYLPVAGGYVYIHGGATRVSVHTTHVCVYNTQGRSHTCVYTHICVHIYVYTYTWRSYTCVCVHTHTYVYITQGRSHTCVYTHTYTHTYGRATCVCVCEYIYTSCLEELRQVHELDSFWRYSREQHCKKTKKNVNRSTNLTASGAIALPYILESHRPIRFPL